MAASQVEVREFDDDPCCMVWLAARVLLSYLEEMSLAGREILELGAGTGFLAISLARRGAQVLAVEGAEQGFENLEHNVRAAGGQVRTLRWDWEKSGLPSELMRSWDLVVATDVVYPRYYDEDGLCRALRELLKLSGGMLLALCDRIMGCQSSLTAFFQACSRYALELRELSLTPEILRSALGVVGADGTHEDPESEQPSRIRLFQVSITPQDMGSPVPSQPV